MEWTSLAPRKLLHVVNCKPFLIKQPPTRGLWTIRIVPWRFDYEVITMVVERFLFFFLFFSFLFLPYFFD